MKLLEVNPNPGWCWDGKLNLMAGFAGMSYADLLRAILEAAQTRIAGTTSTHGQLPRDGAAPPPHPIHAAWPAVVPGRAKTHG